MRNAPPPSKKRKIKTVHEEKINFDPAAREEYLTGFHKRKVARRKHAEEENAKKDKEEKLRFRREVSSLNLPQSGHITPAAYSAQSITAAVSPARRTQRSSFFFSPFNTSSLSGC